MLGPGSQSEQLAFKGILSTADKTTYVAASTFGSSMEIDPITIVSPLASSTLVDTHVSPDKTMEDSVLSVSPTTFIPSNPSEPLSPISLPHHSL